MRHSLFGPARLHLALWYLLILGAVVGVLSVALYELLILVQQSELHAVSRAHAGRTIAALFARDEVTLAYQIGVVDATVVVLSSIGAWLLAGRTLAPIQDAMERQRRFAAAASHELRTPLTALQGTLEVTLLNERSPEEYRAVIREAVTETEQLGRLVRELTLLARAERESGAVSLAAVDLSEVVREAVDRVQPLAARKRQRLQVELASQLPIQGDALKLRQAVLNLLENAIRYTPEEGAIRVVTRRERRRAVLEVRDTGPGISAGHLPHLFEPFYQVNQARSDTGHVGLGLSLVAWIVHAHGGEVKVASRPGSGTIFTVLLPLAG